jgi:hypothetical protein
VIFVDHIYTASLEIYYNLQAIYTTPVLIYIQLISAFHISISYLEKKKYIKKVMVWFGYQRRALDYSASRNIYIVLTLL